MLVAANCHWASLKEDASNWSLKTPIEALVSGQGRGEPASAPVVLVAPLELPDVEPVVALAKLRELVADVDAAWELPVEPLDEVEGEVEEPPPSVPPDDAGQPAQSAQTPSNRRALLIRRILLPARRVGYRRNRRNRRALPTTETELRLIAALAIMGERSRPNAGYSAPAARGMPRPL